jgi:hypothetical protein
MSMSDSIHGFANGDVLTFRGGRSEWKVISAPSFSSAVHLRSIGGAVRQLKAVDARRDLAFVQDPAEGHHARKQRVLEYIARAETEARELEAEIERRAHVDRAPSPRGIQNLSPRGIQRLEAELTAMHVGRPSNYDEAMRALRDARVEAMLRYVAEPTPANWANRAALNTAITEAEKVKGLFG